jgi:hypothetical protein
MKDFSLSLLSLLLLGLGLSVGGCDFLSYDETTAYKKEDVFENLTRTRRFVSNMYSRFRPGGFNSVGGAMRASGADNAEEVSPNSAVQIFNNSSWSPTNTVDSKWNGSPGDMYQGIRAANLLLANFDLDNYDDLQYNDGSASGNEDYESLIARAQYYPYEARFLRAFFHFKLLKRYGSVPLVTSVLTPQEANNIESASYQEIVDFIANEMDAIAPELPVTFENVPNAATGRPTRGAAMALKARALLYAASPLNNPSGEQEKWVEAAEAAKAIIDSSFYSLENNYSDAFNNITSDELIWERRHGPSNDFEQANFPAGYEGASPGTSPTQNLVDAYEMQSSGKPIEASNSGYDPDNPYEGRDPRFYETVIYNGSTWKGREVEVWNGGLDGPPQAEATETGYYLKKYVIEDISISPPQTTTRTHTWVVFRYAEVLLNYAEAMNEAYGPSNPAGMGMTAREAVNMVRARAGMPDFPTGMSQADFREKLRNERRVELAFENHRFWDIRRWKIGPSTTEIYGMEITRNEDGSFNYERELVEERVWNERRNLYPIPQDEISKNQALQQNENW